LGVVPGAGFEESSQPIAVTARHIAMQIAANFRMAHFLLCNCICGLFADSPIRR
jgi:hypothetical protein